MTVEFDLDKFVRNSKRVATEDLSWDKVHDHPLTNGEIRFLQYMMNIESHTIVYLRDLLSTSAIEEDEVTSFLSCWAYEEFFHGHYLEKFVKTYAGDGRVVNQTSARLDNEGRVASALKRFFSPALTAASPDFAATHMTWGAANEYTTLHAYEAVARQSHHPFLKELLARIVKDERRHFAFYFQQADRRLRASPFMQKETRFIMNRIWRPVGAGAMPPKELDFVAWLLFRDEAGQRDVRHVDSVVARLPGMEGWARLTEETERSIGNQEKRDEAAWAYEVAVTSKGARPLVA